MIDEFIKAIHRNDLKKLKELISKNKDSVNLADSHGMSVLMYAILYGSSNPEMVKLLIDMGADVNHIDDDQKWTALHFAARDQKEDIVKLLLENKVNVDIQDKFGNTPLWRCVMNKSVNVNIIKMLLKNGADPNKKNYQGVSPLDIAKTADDKKVIEALK